MQLVVVESPTKARKLKSYLGSGYQVKASFGHVRDLPKSKLGVDVEDNFSPTYTVTGKAKAISELKAAASTADTIILATDPDREGEAIAWHVQHILENARGKNKVSAEFKRATFHEITKAAVMHAIEQPTAVNMDLVDAQQARRVLDRLVGYKVSPVLWKKVRRGLSAGRVQSVALRLLVEREREIEAFEPEEYWEARVVLSSVSASQPQTLYADGALAQTLPEGAFEASITAVDGAAFDPKTKDDVDFLDTLLPGARYVVQEVEQKERKRTAYPPFKTSTLQQAAATRFGYSGKRTMQLAQALYEEGLITYHRTDSFNLSKSSIEMARGFISQQYAPEYLPAKPNYYRTGSKNAQEAHEAIRVTDVRVGPDAVQSKSSKLTAQHQKLYQLIWQRFIASQMTPARYKQTALHIEASHESDARTIGLKATGSILEFDGWMALFPSRDDALLPEVSQGQELTRLDHTLNQKFTQPPARYNDASLVKELESRGIGRPSTYASIISVIIDRGYVERQQRRFFVSPVGIAVCDFLVKNFPNLMEYAFTAKMEDDLDHVAEGKQDWHKLLAAFWKPFSDKLEKAEEAERVQIPVEKTGEQCPECKAGEIVIRSGKYGKFKSCSTYPECQFTENIVETIPGECPLCGKGEIAVKNSRWGKPFYGCSTYPTCDWASWKKPEPGLKITAAEWKVMQAEREERKKKYAERRKKSGSKPKKKTAKKAKKATKKK